MFGPDVCGYSTRKTHVIFPYKGDNKLIKKSVKCETDRLSHRYTLVVHPDNTYEVSIDGAKTESGNLADDWDFLAPKTIKDPAAKKPSDWVDEAQIPDPEDKKPEGHDDVPAKIADPSAKVRTPPSASTQLFCRVGVLTLSSICRSLMIGMRRRMASGSPLRLITLHTRVNGSQR
jgi:hypothetical protein